MNKEIIDKWLDEEYGISYTEMEKLHEYFLDKNIEYRERIDKAIEYIENNKLYDIQFEKNSQIISCEEQSKELLDILKGDNNE